MDRATVGCGSLWGGVRGVVLARRRAIGIVGHRNLRALLMSRIDLDRRTRGLNSRLTVGGTAVGVHDRAQIHRASFHPRETTTATSARQRLWLRTSDRGLRHAERRVRAGGGDGEGAQVGYSIRGQRRSSRTARSSGGSSRIGMRALDLAVEGRCSVLQLNKLRYTSARY